jgi:curved DNA-binding protein CbpA
MTTLYEILGLGQRATAEQVDQAFVLQSAQLKNETQSAEHKTIRLRAIREAHAILSSTVRRQAYDEKMNRTAQVTYQAYQTAEITPFPWLTTALVTLTLLGGGIYYYKAQANKARTEQLLLEKEKAKVELEKAELNAEAEQARLEKAKIFDQERATDLRRRDMEQARREGDQIHSRLEQQAARVIRDREQAERQAKSDQLREDQAARYRAQNANAAMQRALAIPIYRH